ncbi:FMN-binding protein [Nakamurella sp. PAMC28650]|uniref:FMN-binding protein n=1 Tax=Nakamurella sp. PAMC28650 TaxID=2762325 RepID=UPI00164D07CC|nr:FMN-binding protein [Nakamurella sp. PAMC28650]QNK80349.1 FMN-binding protein [Nakamurella sp. PAMC28650]
MKRIVMFFMSTVTVLVLLLGYHTSTSSKAVGGETAFVSTREAGPTSAAAAPATSAAAAPSTNAAAAPSTGKNATVTGSVADTRWGPVQVQLTVQNGKITAVSVVQYPNGNGRDQEINSYALPILVQETITAQSAKVDMVSGATVTSDGYLTSLQSAIDQAGL